MGEREELRLSHFLAVGIGLAVILGSVVVGAVRGNIFEVAGKTINLLGCPLFGMFFLALFVRHATPFGAIMGAVYSTASAVLVAYWDVITGGPGVSFTWIAPVSLATSLAAGWLFSRLPTRGRPRGAIAAYAAASLAALGLIVAGVLGLS